MYYAVYGSRQYSDCKDMSVQGKTSTGMTKYSILGLSEKWCGVFSSIFFPPQNRLQIPNNSKMDLKICLIGVPVFECQVWVCLPGKEEPQTDQLDCAVQAQAQEGTVCK